jgi:hypothetical protein
MLGAVWTTILLFMLTHIGGMADMHHCVQSLIEMGSYKLFARANLKP